MIILLHSSKTMRTAATNTVVHNSPQFVDQAEILNAMLKQLSVAELSKIMHISEPLANKTRTLIEEWSTAPNMQRAAIDSFLGDIYSGLQVQNWSTADRLYADTHLRILSGLYGILRPLDGIHPYRLEMGYRLQLEGFANLYLFWGDSIANTLDTNETIINLSSVEYSKVITKYTDSARIISPVFRTMDPKTKKPSFVAVHSKIARGAFAGWLIKNRIDEPGKLKEFSELGYAYSPALSTPEKPVFVCDSFKGLGLSVRLT